LARAHAAKPRTPQATARYDDGNRTHGETNMIRSFKGKTPQIDPSAFISEACYIVGDVVIGPNVSIWPGVVLRADHGTMTIGEGTNIQDGSVCHADADMNVGKHVTIGHSVVCHARLVGDHCLLGNHSTLNDGATVREWSIVAAGAVVLEDREIPGNSIAAGVPAKVIGSMTDKHYDMVRRIPESYVRMAAEYKAEGGLE
jgi:carbonic anhydrase/acetyltransferase-like protein (isoleucine patch superfamily)